MFLADKYRPKGLADIVGQPGPVRFMRNLVAAPQRCCLLFESPVGGCGKTASAHALAADLGCHDEFTGRWQFPCSEFTVDAARELFGRTLRLRWDNPSGFSVLILEEMDWLSPQTARFLKVALDPAGSMPQRLIVCATSNGAGGLDKALLQRFRLFSFSSGPTFAAACHERLAEIWAAETDDADMPAGWQRWGFRGDDFSMRLALAALDDSLLGRAVAA